MRLRTIGALVCLCFTLWTYCSKAATKSEINSDLSGMILSKDDVNKNTSTLKQDEKISIEKQPAKDDQNKQETKNQPDKQNDDKGTAQKKPTDEIQDGAQSQKQAKLQDAQAYSQKKGTEAQQSIENESKNKEDKPASAKEGVIASDQEVKESSSKKKLDETQSQQTIQKKNGLSDREIEIDLTEEEKAKQRLKWQKAGKMPEPNNSFGLVREGQKAYLLGGYNGSHYVADFWEYDLETQQWKKLPSMPIARAGFAVVYLYGKIYAIGGVNEAGVLNRVDIYDFGRKTWVAGPALKLKRYQHDALLMDDRIIVIGGTSDNNKSCEYLEPNNNTWKDFPELNIGRDSHKSVNMNGTLIVIGGKSKGGIQKLETLSSPYYQWNFYDDMNAARFGFGALKYKKGIIILGGFKEITGRTFYEDVFIYYIYNKISKALTSLPVPLANFGTILYKNNIYIFGGRNQEGLKDQILRMEMGNENIGNH